MTSAGRLSILVMLAIGTVLAFLSLGTTAMTLFWLVMSKWFPLAMELGGDRSSTVTSGWIEYGLLALPLAAASLLLWRAYVGLASNGDAGAIALRRIHGRFTLVLSTMIAIALVARAWVGAPAIAESPTRVQDSLTTPTSPLVVTVFLLLAIVQVVSALAALPIVRRTAA